MRYLVGIAVSAALLVSPVLTTGGFAGDKGEKVAIEQLPAPVKATVEKEAKGGTVADVVKETEKGKTFYEAKITDKNGKERFVHVADSGKVLKRESAKAEAKAEAKDAKEDAKKK
jgi:hypothetical protein